MPDVIPGLLTFPFGAIHLVLGLAMAAMVYRFVAGPTEYDRLAAFECFVIVFLTFVAVQVVEGDKDWVLDFILVMSVVGYLSTVALAQFQGLGELPDPRTASEVFGPGEDVVHQGAARDSATDDSATDDSATDDSANGDPGRPKEDA